MSKVAKAINDFIEILPDGDIEKEDNSPVPPGATGILPQSRFTLPVAELKLISPRRARVSLAADAGGKEAFTIVSVILPVARTFKLPPAVIQVLPFVASEIEPASKECIPPTFCVNPPLVVSV